MCRYTARRASAFVSYSGGNRRAGQVSLVRGVDTASD